jgi:sugar phosphate isomerase/epimerase
MIMRLSLCNEVLGGMEFPAQCDYAAAVGYDGLEVAPFTLSDQPHLIGAGERQKLRRAAADAGIAVTGLHWLLVKPAGLSITSDDAGIRGQTVEVMKRLIALCADLGGRVLVHGSPAQRPIPAGSDARAALNRARDCWAIAGAEAVKSGVTYCIEPLAPRETPLINTVAEAAALVREIGSPGLRTMLDCSAAGAAEAQPVAAVLERWLPTGLIAHVQLNDRNRRGPGQGEDRFAPILQMLQRHHYAGDLAVEPFDYVPDGPACAARAAGYVRGLLEALER